MPDLPPNIEDAYRTELRGVEARIALTDGDKRAAYEARAATLRGLLGEEAPVAPKRRGRPPAETRPADAAVETREG